MIYSLKLPNELNNILVGVGINGMLHAVFKTVTNLSISFAFK